MQFSVISSKLGDSSARGSSYPKNRVSECCAPSFFGKANNVTTEPTNKLYLCKSCFTLYLSLVWGLLKVKRWKQYFLEISAEAEKGGSFGSR